MTWNWQLDKWPEFRYDKHALVELENIFLQQSGVLLGMEKCLRDEDRDILIVEAMSDEAMKTSEIEGEYLNRESVQSSIRRNFGIGKGRGRVGPAEAGIGEMMYDLYSTYGTALTEEQLCKWHKMLTLGRDDLEHMGAYRTHAEAMQVVSGRVEKPIVHFEAPPSKDVSREMKRFIKWFNDMKKTLHPLIRSGIAHLYFVCIHPFEDGNGRIARAISEKALSESLGRPTLIALSHIIEKYRKDYYNALAKNNNKLDITDWLIYYGKTVVEAQKYTESLIAFLVDKTKLYDRMSGKLNERQQKVLQTMFEAGVEGFIGGLSAENYLRIAKTSRATATRDLRNMLEVGALIKKGELKSTRYFLNL